MAEAGAETIAVYLAHVVAETLRPLVPAGSRVLDFGDRRGRVALHLAAAGVEVERFGESPAREGRGRPFAGAYAEVDEWPAAHHAACGLAQRLETGAPVLLRLARRAGQSVAGVVRDLGPEFAFRRTLGLGLLVPREAQSDWAARHPGVFAGLCALEGLVRPWPGLARAGREALVLGVRR